MRLFFVALFIIIATNIGANAIKQVNQMQDDKMSAFCKSVPIGASYDDVCKEFR